MTAAPEFEGATLQLRRVVAAPRAAVFRAWTDPDWLRQWFGGGSALRADLDVRVGGEYRIEMKSNLGAGRVFGTYLEVEPPERLVYTFCWDALPVRIPETRVTVEFHERDSATEVVITHERQPSRRVRDFHQWGWTQSLDSLAGMLEALVNERT